MKAPQDPQEDRQLSQVLKQWVEDAPLPPRFQERVWQRIADAEAKPNMAIGFWGLVRQVTETNLLRPRFAYAYVASLVLLGILSGAWAARRETHRLNADLSSRYVQSIDPYHTSASRQ